MLIFFLSLICFAQVVSDDVYKRLAQFTLARTVTELLMYANHSVNFFLYCATGHKFRQQVLVVLRSLCSRATIGRFRHGPGRAGDGGRGMGKSGVSYDVDGCGRPTMTRSCYGYSMTMRQTSTSVLALDEGLKTLPSGTGDTREPGDSGSYDVDFASVEAQKTDNSVRGFEGVKNGHGVYKPAGKGERYRLLVNCDNESSIAPCDSSYGGRNSLVTSRRLSGGTRVIPTAHAFTNGSKSQEHYQMSVSGGNRDNCGQINGNGNSIDRLSRKMNCHTGPGNSTSSEPCSQSHKTCELSQSQNCEINGNSNRKVATKNSKPAKGIVLFTKRSSGKSSLNKVNTSRNKESSEHINSNGRPSTTNWSKQNSSRRSRSNDCGGNAARSGDSVSWPSHGCKLHYYSNKRLPSKPQPVSTGVGSLYHDQPKENEYVLLTPKMHWCNSASSLS